MFWVDNDEWTSRYIQGGMYEINVLADYSDDPSILDDKITLFFTHYKEALADIAQKKEIVKDHIQDFFNRIEPRTKDNRELFERRLDHLNEFFQIQEVRYRAAFDRFLQRLPIKKALDDMGEKRVDILEQNPKLKMYYLANKDRYASFYLISDEDLVEIKEILKRI